MIQEKKEITKHMPKKHSHIFVPSQRYQDSRHLLQNPTVPNYVMGYSNGAQRFTPLNYLSLDSLLFGGDNMNCDMMITYSFFCASNLKLS